MTILAQAMLPLLRCLDPERAHALTLWGVGRGFAGGSDAADDPILAIEAFGKKFVNPVGLAAGFDKNGLVPDSMRRLGFGFVEVGSVTPRPQPGNPRPRLFRLSEDGAVINRMGFNSEGHDAVAARLRQRRRVGVIGINLGANKDSPDRVADYADGLTRFADLADYVAVNISSPNTPGLRNLQGRAELDGLLSRVMAARAKLTNAVPVLLKIAPDLAADDLADAAGLALRHGVSGLIVGNTTIGHRDGLRSKFRNEFGGLSGRPLFAPSTAVLAEVWRLVGGRIPLVGVGGIGSGEDAYAKVCAGASLIQLYTALVYQGPGLIGAIKRDLAARLRADGFKNLSEAVGSGVA
ncbi:MAG TPA: quinone-dependent dihydroorotate dehydrogenase [Candidatus Cybelea sp.]|nr:quinone-dependent dihydroorotate dehydrogenase [Candidatus Cybelea sp.]